MRTPRRPLLTVVAGLTAGALLTACGGGNSLGGGEDEEAASGSEGGGEAAPVTVGLLVPTSGVYAPLGEDMQQGFQLFLDQNGGELGGHPAELEVVDEGETPDTGVPSAQRLIQQEVDAVVGIVNSATALGVRDAFEEAQVPLVIANAGANAITGEQSSDYVWRTSFANGDVAAALGPHAAENCESVFLIAADYAAGKEATGGFEKTFTEAGGKVAGSVFTPFGTTTNYQPFLAQIQQSGADCVYSFFAGAEAVAFTKQYDQFGLNDTIQLYSSGFLTEGGVLQAAGEAATGVETSLHYSDQLDTPENQEFVEAYRAEYDEAPTVYAVQAYDAAQALDQAFETGTEGAEVVEGLMGIDTISSPRGEFGFSEGHGPEQTYYLRRVEQGEDGLVNTVVEELTGS